MAFDGDVLRELATQFLALAGKQGARAPLLIGHRLMGNSLSHAGDIAGGRAHFDQAAALYDPAEHRSLTTRFPIDPGVAILGFRAHVLWILAIPRPHLPTPGKRSRMLARLAKPPL